MQRQFYFTSPNCEVIFIIFVDFIQYPLLFITGTFLFGGGAASACEGGYVDFAFIHKLLQILTTSFYTRLLQLISRHCWPWYFHFASTYAEHFITVDSYSRRREECHCLSLRTPHDFQVNEVFLKLLIGPVGVFSVVLLSAGFRGFIGSTGQLLDVNVFVHC